MKGEEIMQNQEGLKDFTFANDYVFCSILTENPHVCKKIAELAIGRKIKKIVKVQAQKSVKESVDGKGVRFDVIFEDDENSVYDVEMQRYSNDNFPKRARYYQSLLDLEALGQGTSYDKLKDGYIIFICTFDPFEKGDYRYIAKTKLENYPDYDYDDGTFKIFLNAAYKKDDMDPELRAFLDYVNKGTVQSDFVSELEKLKNKLMSSAERRERFMTLQENYKMHEQIGFEKGVTQGITQGIQQGITQGELNKVLSLFLKNKLSKSEAIEESGLTEAEFEKYLSEHTENEV
jgi:predicted transposase/invertase (TIGR01784 family)